jgi:hypothetical protein
LDTNVPLLRNNLIYANVNFYFRVGKPIVVAHGKRRIHATTCASAANPTIFHTNHALMKCHRTARFAAAAWRRPFPKGKHLASGNPTAGIGVNTPMNFYTL